MTCETTVLDKADNRTVQTPKRKSVRQGAVLKGTPVVNKSAQKLADHHAALLERVSAGDRAAYKALFEHYAPRLKAFAMRGGLASESAEEVMQEAMIAVWRRADSFDARKASASTWMFTIVRNKRIDFLRRAGKPDLTADDFAHLETEAPAADLAFEKLQDEAKVSKTLKSLPADQLEVIRKAFFEDKSHAEVAADLDLPLGTVKSRIRLALGKLRTLMENQS